MGGLRGHVIPGTMFVSFSIWWLIGEVLQKNAICSLPTSVVFMPGSNNLQNPR